MGWSWRDLDFGEGYACVELLVEFAEAGVVVASVEGLACRVG
jgi:hypothetical protein